MTKRQLIARTGIAIPFVVFISAWVIQEPVNFLISISIGTACLAIVWSIMWCVKNA
jgi:uncharacterized membrane protein